MKINNFNIFEQNKHFDEGFFYDVYRRRIEESILNTVEDKRIIAVLGLRRIGKTHLLKSIINQLINFNIPRKNIMYFSFDKFGAYRGDAIRDCIDQYLGEFHSTNLDIIKEKEKYFFFLDEVQKVPFFNSNIKAIYDFHPNFKFFISGSSSYNIRKDQNETLAGRIIDIKMKPLDWQEFIEIRDRVKYPAIDFLGEVINSNNINADHNIYKRPKVQLIDFLRNKDIIEAISINNNSYISESIVPKILDRELIVSSTGKDNVNFFNLAPVIFNYNGKILNQRRLVDQGIGSKYQISSALELGEKLFFWKILKGKQKDKIYTSSTSIAFNIQTDKNIGLDVDGLLFENKVFQKLSTYSNELTYYNERNNEIDFILGQEIGIECKLGDLGKLTTYINSAEKLNLKKLIFIGQDYVKYEKKNNLDIWVLPWWMV